MNKNITLDNIIAYLKMRKNTCSNEHFEGLLEMGAHIGGISVDEMYCMMNYSHLRLFHNLRGGSFHFYDYFNLG